MRTRTRIAVAALAITAILIPAGCSSAQPEADDKKPLTLWTFKQSHVDALEEVGEKWSKESGRTVEVKAFNSDQAFDTAVRAAARTGDLPDMIATHSYGEHFQYAQDGLMIDITEYFDDEWKGYLLKDALDISPLTQAQVDQAKTLDGTGWPDLVVGDVYAVPMAVGSAGVVYASKPALEAAGVDTSAPPATWEEFVESIGKTVEHDPENGSIVAGLQVSPVGYFWMYRPMSAAYLGKEAFDLRESENTKAGWNSPESLHTLELYSRLTPLWKEGSLNLTGDQADQAFAAGQAAWSIGGTFTLGFFKQQGMNADDVMAFPVPAPEGGEKSKVGLAMAPLVSLGVSTKAADPELAADYIKFLNSPVGSETFLSVAGDLPAGKVSDKAMDELSPLMRSMLGFADPGDEGILFNTGDFSATPQSPTILQATSDELNKIPAGAATPERVGDALTKLYADAWASLK